MALLHKPVIALIDGPSAVMRFSFADATPNDAVGLAWQKLDQFRYTARLTHAIVCFDSRKPNVRLADYPGYKGNKTVDTTPYVAELYRHLQRMGWTCAWADGYEADDSIAAYSLRLSRAGLLHLVLSNDSDLVPLTANGATVYGYVTGGLFEPRGAAWVRAKYGVDLNQLQDFKALAGETGDGIPKVAGIGKKRAASLLGAYGSLDGVLEAGRLNADVYSRKAYEGETTLRLARTLIRLRDEAPVPPMSLRQCLLPQPLVHGFQTAV